MRLLTLANARTIQNPGQLVGRMNIEVPPEVEALLGAPPFNTTFKAIITDFVLGSGLPNEPLFNQLIADGTVSDAPPELWHQNGRASLFARASTGEPKLPEDRTTIKVSKRARSVPLPLC